MGLLRSDQGRRAARLLEFGRLLDTVAEHCALERAAQRVRELDPLDERAALDELWAWVDELARAHAEERDLPLGSFSDLEDLLGRERRRRGPLGGEELASVAGAARGLSVLLEHVRGHAAQLVRSAAHLREAFDPRPLADHLEAALESDGRLKDGASPRLGALRRAAVASEGRVRDTARRALGHAVNAGWTTGSELVLRGNRFCVPLRSGSRRKVEGIVHDRSDTGSTIFVEPMAVVEAGNELAEARLAVEDEERRILVALNRAVAQDVDGLLDLFDRALHLDGIRARVRWGVQWGGQTPRFSEEGRIDLEDFRHPLLRESLAAAGRAEDLVPLNLRLNDPRVVVISGPNAGGKTVTLKSLGLAVFLAQSGIPLPASQPPVLPVFDHVLLDLGDEQSIADALSSFSAHLTHLGRVLALATPRSLVLLDEIGGGTDPQEGVALARAILEELAARGCRTLATTHYGQLKALVEDDDRFRHASMAFDQERLVPRFELRLDVPGSSHALSIASRLQMPESLMHRARELLGDERLQLDALLESMEEERARLRGLREELTEQSDHAKLERTRYERLARELKQSRRESLDRAEREAEGIVRNARRKVERLLADIREAAADDPEAGAAAVAAAQQAREEIERKVSTLRERQERRRGLETPARRARVEVGAHVRHEGLGQVGRVIEVRGDKVTLEIGAARVVARRDQLRAPDEDSAPMPAPRPEGTVRTELVDASPIAARRVDVRGLDAEEAWAEVDRALDRGLLTGMGTLEVIHGKGTGRLRKVIGERLSRDPRVKDASVGGGGEHDDGVTVVEL